MGLPLSQRDSRFLHEIEASDQPVWDGAQTPKSHSIQKEATRIVYIYKWKKKIKIKKKKFDINPFILWQTSPVTENTWRPWRRITCCHGVWTSLPHCNCSQNMSFSEASLMKCSSWGINWSITIPLHPPDGEFLKTFGVVGLQLLEGARPWPWKKGSSLG